MNKYTGAGDLHFRDFIAIFAVDKKTNILLHFYILYRSHFYEFSPAA